MVGRLSAVGLVVAALAAGCGDAAPQRGCADDPAGTSGVRLTYRAQEPAADGDLRAAADKLCLRVEGLAAERPAVAVEGDRIVVVVPGGTPPAIVELIGSPGRLAFYDWEPVILDDDCRAEPDLNAGDRSPVVARARAEGIAAKCRGAVAVVRQERPQPNAPKPDAWWVVRDEPVLDGEDVVDPRAGTDPQTAEPIVTMRFTPAGLDAFARVTRNVAERGADNAVPGAHPATASHHFAIVLDGELVSTPFVDFNENPDGIDGADGVQIAGGFTKESARVLARMLALGPLEVPLELVERRYQP